jgi:polyisoprenoid-binding protein YceI
MKKVLLPAMLLSGICLVMTAYKRPTPANAEKNTAAYPVETGKWTLDKNHSNVKFTVTHLVVSEVEGNFKIFDGTMENSKEDFSDAKINFTVDVASIDTDNERRDNHLKGDDFFNAEKFPAMKFESTSMKSLGNNKYTLAGNLTIRDVTKPVSFDVTYGGSIAAMGTTKVGFTAKTTINRFDYNLKWDKTTEAGSLVVSKEVDIKINVELNKSK